MLIALSVSACAALPATSVPPIGRCADDHPTGQDGCNWDPGQPRWRSRVSDGVLL